MKSTTRTTVSKSSPAIKAIIAATFPEWTGRKVTVVDVIEGWQSTQYVDDRSVWMLVNLETLQTARAAAPSYGGPAVVHPVPADGCAYAVLVRYPGAPDSIEIVVEGRWTVQDLEPVADALEAKQPKLALAAARAALADDSYANAAAEYGGIVVAVAEGARKNAARVAVLVTKKAEFMNRTVWA